MWKVKCENMYQSHILPVDPSITVMYMVVPTKPEFEDQSPSDKKDYIGYAKVKDQHNNITTQYFEGDTMKEVISMCETHYGEIQYRGDYLES